MQREALLRAYANTDLKPSKHATNARLALLRNNLHPAAHKEAALLELGTEVPPPLLRQFLSQLFAAVRLEALAHGNVGEADAAAAAAMCREVAAAAAAASSAALEEAAGAAVAAAAADARALRYPEQRVLKLSAMQHLVHCVEVKDLTESNSALEAYWQIGPDTLQARAAADLLEEIMSEPLYDQLRTKEQLGYAVGCGVRVTAGVLGFVVRVQSASHGPAHLYKRTHSFLREFGKLLKSLKGDEWSDYTMSLAKNKLQRDYSLSEEAGRHWPEIDNRRYAFHHNLDEARAVLAIRKKVLAEKFRDWFVDGSPGCRRMTVLVCGARRPAAAELAAFRGAVGAAVAKGVAVVEVPDVAGLRFADGVEFFPNFV
ncbi:unnamed protein product [Phaeothamnion confervicola]